MRTQPLPLGQAISIATSLEALMFGVRHLELDADRADAAGTFVRARELLRSARALASEGAPAALGLIARALYEEWLVAVIVCRGSESDRDRVTLDYLHWALKHKERFELELDDPPTAIAPMIKAWGTWDRAGRVDEIIGGSLRPAHLMYSVVFSAESFLSTHAGPATTLSHAKYSGHQKRSHLTSSPHEVGEVSGRLSNIAMLAGEIAVEVFTAAGLSAAAIHEALEPAGVPDDDPDVIHFR